MTTFSNTLVQASTPAADGPDRPAAAEYAPPAATLLGGLEAVQADTYTGNYDGPSTRWCRR